MTEDDLTARITEVVRHHERGITANWDTKVRCECDREYKFDFASKYEHAVHVAEQIVKELGPDTEQNKSDGGFDRLSRYQGTPIAVTNQQLMDAWQAGFTEGKR